MTLKRLIGIELIIAVIMTFAPVPTFATEVESNVMTGDTIEQTSDSIVSYVDDKMYDMGYELGYTLGSSNRTKDYEAPEYPDNESYMKGLDEGYAKGISELVTCGECNTVYNKTQCKECPNAENHIPDVELGCGGYGEEFTCDYCGDIGYNGIDGHMGEHYLHYECEEGWMEYITEMGYLD